MLHFNAKLSKPVLLGVVLFSVAALLIACASQNAANVKTAGETKLITDIVASEDADSAIVTVKGNQTLTYTAIKQVFPLGVLFHFPETALDNIENVYYPPENDTISSIKATQIEEDGMTSRIFIALKTDRPYDITLDDTGLHITFPKAGMPIAEEALESEQIKEVEIEPAPEAPKTEKTASSPATRLTSVTATPLKKNVVINVKADGKIDDYKYFTVNNPPRIVFDLFKLKSPYKGEQRIAVESKWVNKIRHFGYPDKIRMVLETNKADMSKFFASPVDKGLLIYVGAIPATASLPEPKPVVAQAPPPPDPEHQKTSGDETTKTTVAEIEEPVVVQVQSETKPEQNQTTNDQAQQPAVEEAKAPEVKAEAASIKFDKPAWLNRIDFSSEEAGKSAIIIGTTRPVEYQMSNVSDRKLQLKLLETNLPEYRKRALITTRFQSAVDRITPTQRSKTNDTVITIELREAVPYVVKKSDSLIRINFSPSSIPPKPYEDAKLPAWKRVLEEPDTELSTAAAIKAPKAGKTKKANLEHQRKKDLYIGEETGRSLNSDSAARQYTGEPIVLDFYDTDIKNVFRIIKEISGKNFAIDKKVTGKVTLTLEKPVPWDQVLDLVLKMNDLGMKMEGDIVRISTLATIKKEEELEKAKLAAAQKKKKQVDLETAFLPVNYASATTMANLHIKPLISPTRVKDGASVTVDSRLSMIVLTDVPSVIQRAKQIIQRIDQVTPQVAIEARIVEANTNFTRELGFDWGQVIAGPFDIGDATLTLAGLASNLPATIPSGVVGGTFSKLSGTPFQIIDARLVASETEGKTNIISAPKVVTLNNKKAKIKQGLEVPYLERDSSGNATVRFKNVDLLLEVTPNITPDDRIIMKIFVTKNDVVDPSADQPALSTNEAETELLVDNGDTVVIGGIVKSTLQYAEKGIPGLRKLGVLGWLFKSQERQDSKNELLIFITPRIVKLEQRNQL